jgi:Undecaprenyl-phosphate galactose phosphotransferase WbaP
MFVVWTVGVAMLIGTLGGNRWLWLVTFYLSSLLTLPICRSWLRQLLGKYTKWGIPALVCGNDAAAIRVFHWLADNHHLGLRPVGVIGDRASLGVAPDDTWYAGSWSETPDVADKGRVFWAVVVPSDDQSVSVSSLITDYLYTIPQVHVLSELTGLPDQWNPQQLDGLSGIHLQQNLMLPLPRLTKRCIDFVASVIGGVVLLPLLFYLAVAVKMSSRGPILYGHTRIGRYGIPFKAWKFRTMFEDSSQVSEQYLEANPGLMEEWQRDHKLRFDPRITRIGRFLRKTSLDELPQLWNVIRGDTSLVGPRPIVTAEIGKYGPYYGLYTMVKPGITGLWQVSGRYNTTYDERVQFDAYYVRNWSPWMDIALLLKTFRIVLFARGAY